MSNIAGKAYAMNVITPVRWYLAWFNRLIFKIAANPSFLQGLISLSLIHYARWAVIGRNKFPHFEEENQPKEDLNYSYMLFCSNFNGSWDQYVDSFTFAIPSGLDLF